MFLILSTHPMADLSVLDPVEVFAVGVHPTDDGPREYTHQDLDRIVANFQRLSDPSTASPLILEPTCVLGHEEDEDENKFWANLSTGVPSCGRVTKLTKNGDKLFARIEDVPTDIQKALANKLYTKVSSEIYDNFEDQGQDYGMALRRIAFLGGEIPQVKNLSDILAHVKMSERKSKTTRVTFFSEKFCDDCGGTCGNKNSKSFQEADSMDRAQMLEALQAMGVDTSVIDDATPDAVLEAWLKSVGGGAEEVPAEETFEEEEVVDPELAMVDPNAVPPEEEQMFADEFPPEEMPAGAAEPMANPLEDPMAKMSCKKYSEKLARYVQKCVANAVKKEKISADRKETIRQFSERLKAEGKVVPSMLDGADGKPTLETVLSLVAGQPVRKFGEKKVDPLKVVMEFFENLPPIAKFSEHLKIHKADAVSNDRINDLLKHSSAGRQVLAQKK